MLSRAHLLIEREYQKLQTALPWGIEAFPLKNDNIFEWVAKIQGLKDTLWEGGIFKLYIRFDENFSIRPPEVCFHTVPFHPNVDMVTGRPCIEFLDSFEQWKESYSLSMILLSVQSLLSNPSLQNAVNLEAVEMIERSPHSYKQMVLDCVAASQRVEAGEISATEEEPKVKFVPHVEDKRNTSLRTAPTHVTKLSFDDYYLTWCGIATSKTNVEAKNPLLEAIKDKPHLQKAHMGLPQEEIEEQIKKQMEEHSSLIYGKFGMKPTAAEEKAAKLDRLQKMRKIYLPPRVSPSPVPQDIILDGALPVINTSKDEPWEKEVDDLVAWTNNLDAATIDA